jgi:hypothetical protein
MTILDLFAPEVNPTGAPQVEADLIPPAEVEPTGPSAADDTWHASQNTDWDDEGSPDWDALAEESAMLAAYEAGCLPLCARLTPRAPSMAPGLFVAPRLG